MKILSLLVVAVAGITGLVAAAHPHHDRIHQAREKARIKAAAAALGTANSSTSCGCTTTVVTWYGEPTLIVDHKTSYISSTSTYTKTVTVWSYTSETSAIMPAPTSGAPSEPASPSVASSLSSSETTVVVPAPSAAAPSEPAPAPVASSSCSTEASIFVPAPSSAAPSEPAPSPAASSSSTETSILVPAGSSAAPSLPAPSPAASSSSTETSILVPAASSAAPSQPAPFPVASSSSTETSILVPAASSAAPSLPAPAPVAASSSSSPETSALVSAASSAGPSQPAPSPVASSSSTETSIVVPPPSSAAASLTPSAAASAVASSTSAAPSTSSSEPSSSGSAAISSDGNLWAMTYSPYTSSGTCKDATSVAADVATIKAKGFTSVRIYSTDCSGLESVGNAARQNGLKMVLGIYISSSGIAGAQPQVSDILSWGQWDLVELVVIGNEAIFNGWCDAGSLAAFISSCKSQFCSAGYTGLVTTTEPLDIWQSYGSALCSVIDVIAANLHPFFNPDVTADNAGTFVASELVALEAVCPGKAAYNVETGWPHAGEANGDAVPGPTQQATAIKAIENAVGSKVVFFSFEDDLWKQPGEFDVEQSWGCADVFSG